MTEEILKKCNKYFTIIANCKSAINCINSMNTLANSNRPSKSDYEWLGQALYDIMRESPEFRKNLISVITEESYTSQDIFSAL